jgi:signal transduction histidine kinase
VVATAPLAARRRYPIPVLLTTVSVLLAMMALRVTVGLSPLGAIIAFYTVVAWGTRRQGRAAVLVLAVTAALTAAIRPVDLSVEGALVNSAVFGSCWLLGNGARERREFFAAEVDSMRQRAELERRLAEAERDRADQAITQERLRITRELHDVIGHAMSVMVVQAGVAERMLEDRPGPARDAVRQIAATGRSSLGEMRRLIAVLRDGDDAAAPRDPAPTLSSLPQLASRVRAAGLPVELDLDDAVSTLPEGVQLAAYRVVQEALTNCLKHAAATRAWVAVAVGAGGLELTVRDDGVGEGSTPGADAVPGREGRGDAAPGMGLSGMRQRVGIYGGEFSAGADAAGGYRVRARFPLDSPADSPADTVADGARP